MGYPLDLALRYMQAKKRAFVSVSTAFAVLGVALGVAALTTARSVTSGFQTQFREKVLGVNAHVLVLKYSTDFREYRDVMASVATVPGVVGVAPFIINPMMVSHGDRTATGVLLKGIDPVLMPKVLDLPGHIRLGSLAELRRPGAKPPARSSDMPGAYPLDPPSPPPTGSGALPKQRAPSAQEDDEPEPERDGEGRNVPLLKALRDSFADAGGAMHVDPAAAQRAREQASARTDVNAIELPLPADAPYGSVEPVGGYKSKLPDDSDLPPDIAPDPCSDPKATANLPGIVVGASLSKTLAAKIGDCVEVTSPTIGYSFSSGSIKPPVAKQFRVVAVFEAGFDQYDSKLVYTDLYEAQGFYDQGDTVTGVEMRVADIDKARQVATRVSDLLANSLYRTMDWEELNHSLFTALLFQKWGITFVMALIELVAAFTVVATLIMVVLEKKKEIAVLKTMGATDAAILRSFVYQGGIIGLIGTSLGLAAGWLSCRALAAYPFPLDAKVYFISHLPVEVSGLDFVGVGIGAILICLLATLFPAVIAARLRPAEAFREI